MIDVCIETPHTFATIDLNLIVIIVKIENMIKLIVLHIIYVLIFKKMRIKSNLKRKPIDNNCKLSCDDNREVIRQV